MADEDEYKGEYGDYEFHGHDVYASEVYDIIYEVMEVYIAPAGGWNIDQWLGGIDDYGLYYDEDKDEWVLDFDFDIGGYTGSRSTG